MRITEPHVSVILEWKVWDSHWNVLTLLCNCLFNSARTKIQRPPEILAPSVQTGEKALNRPNVLRVFHSQTTTLDTVTVTLVLHHCSGLYWLAVLADADVSTQNKWYEIKVSCICLSNSKMLNFKWSSGVICAIDMFYFSLKKILTTMNLCAFTTGTSIGLAKIIKSCIIYDPENICMGFFWNLRLWFFF